MAKMRGKGRETIERKGNIIRIMEARRRNVMVVVVGMKCLKRFRIL
jgi:hypothetical protein